MANMPRVYICFCWDQDTYDAIDGNEPIIVEDLRVRAMLARFLLGIAESKVVFSSPQRYFSCVFLFTWPLRAAAPPGCRSTNLSMLYLLGFSKAPMPATSSLDILSQDQHKPKQVLVKRLVISAGSRNTRVRKSNTLSLRTECFLDRAASEGSRNKQGFGSPTFFFLPRTI
jgi:hypothetical protein